MAPRSTDPAQLADEEAARRSSVFFRGAGSGGGGARQMAAPSSTPPAVNTNAGIAASSQSPFNAMATGTSPAAAPSDPTTAQNRQDAKGTFMTKAGEGGTRNQGSPQLPTSPYQVMAGTVISAALVTGINSEVPGQVIASANQAVYNTATGRRLLVPQGARLNRALRQPATRAAGVSRLICLTRRRWRWTACRGSHGLGSMAFSAVAVHSNDSMCTHSMHRLRIANE